jgi:hypothetical protein
LMSCTAHLVSSAWILPSWQTWKDKARLVSQLKDNTMNLGQKYSTAMEKLNWNWDRTYPTQPLHWLSFIQQLKYVPIFKFQISSTNSYHHFQAVNIQAININGMWE